MAIINSMSNPILVIPSEFDAAPQNQRIAFVQELWDRIAQEPEKVPVPDSHKRILDDRLDVFRTWPQAGCSWSEVRDQILAKLSAP